MPSVAMAKDGGVFWKISEQKWRWLEIFAGQPPPNPQKTNLSLPKTTKEPNERYRLELHFAKSGIFLISRLNVLPIVL